jgi:hypothetical protein
VLRLGTSKIISERRKQRKKFRKGHKHTLIENMEPMNGREVGRKKMRHGVDKIRTGLCGLGRTTTENEVCINP